MLNAYQTTRTIPFAILLLTSAPYVLGAQTAAPPKTTTLLRTTAKTFSSTKTFNFTLAAKQVSPGLRLGGVVQGEGTAVSPEHLLFSGTIQQTPALAMSFVTLVCGPDQYIELGDGNFEKMPGSPNVGRLLFSDTNFVSSILQHLEKPSEPQAATVDNVAMWRIAGTVPSNLLALLPTPATSPATALRAELWIGQKDSRLRQVALTGPMFQGDSATTTRMLTFSHFNEKANFAVPRGTVPCKP